MKKYVAICSVLAALIWVGVAAADTPQGSLAGSALIGPAGFEIFVSFGVIDGGTSYVGQPNDKSGNCDGDSGIVNYDGSTYPVACAHYVAISGCCNAGSP